ncbi:hypothetical protein [Tautonia plasticadhaerens]|uniref:hypothetical protein n=1 Tax=Tautonia plasticadhaerens TaxID=2527974 RepID=UPI0011A7AEE4|nr:hypothetical protein [Tautonia plasticadhaerens]
MAKPPSSKQLGFLKKLGYEGVEPSTLRQASIAIGEMLESKDSKAAERAITKQRKSEEKRGKQAMNAQLQPIKEEIRFMVRENRAYGGQGLFAGFQFVAIEDERPGEDDEPYIGAFVPLQVAEKHPEILLRDALDYEEVLSESKLPRGTRVVVAPGQFKALHSSLGCLGSFLVLATGLSLLASLA